jgi:hypothetical protein
MMLLSGVIGLSLASLFAPVQADRKGAPPAPVRFARDIQPILSDRCFRCHGPDARARQANLRLDTQEGIRRAFMAGKPEQSLGYLRMVEKRPALRMPPPNSHLTVHPSEIARIRTWIAQGAKWEKHWAFISPTLPALPKVKSRAWARNPIDLFVLARLEREGLKPSPPAPRHTLIRRVTLDLTGLPPTPEEVAAFVTDRSPNAYEKVVDRLLASPRFGERMVWEWLDGARYSDTNGFQEDRARPMWPWRDWAIEAINRNLPYDQFVIEQTAGDLLPNATLSQRIATGFHRNHMLNGEGGRIAEESRVEYVVDRVDTTATLFLGLTMACARCHDHKYDPISMKDYYRLYAYFNSIAETGAVDRDGSANPVLTLPTPEQEEQIARLKRKLEELDRQIAPLERESPERAALQKEREAAQKSLDELNRSVLTTMVLEDLPKPRETFILLRGAYDKYGEKVTVGTPEALPPLPKDAPPNRLGLARWLVAPDNPLTARVTVNRLWQQLFGIGLVKTAEDFGLQGERPSHPELLDWLAVTFQRGSRAQTPWNVKAMVRLIVTSATYRQSSCVTPALLARDPENRLLARGPRYRLPSWMLRDQALALSGLLVEKVGGPPVKPYQPEGVWEDFSYGKITYQQDHGEALYRRSLYIFWRRSVAPTMLFDTASRQVCTVRVARTNTPLQALTLLNDITYVEASRAFAERTLKQGGATPQQRLAFAFQTATARPPKPQEMAVLERSLRRWQERYRRHPEEARRLIAVGESKPDPALDPSELAAYTGVCSLILNLDEVLSKE